MKVCLWSYGRMKSPGLSEARNYLVRNLKRWVNFEENELKAKAVMSDSEAERLKVQESEGQELLKKLGPLNAARDRLLLLDERGKSLNTLQWVEQFEQWEQSAYAQIHLVIGSSRGFSQALRSQAHGSLSLGPQTLSHELARLVLLEQIYRAYSVIKHHPYHVEG